MLKLHDIKDIIQVPDNSLYYLIFMVLLFLVLLTFILMKSYKYFFNDIKKQKKEYLNLLKNIDLKNSKQASYLITKYSTHLLKTKEQKDLFLEINEALNKYKYIKNALPFSNDFLIKFETFKEKLYV